MTSGEERGSATVLALVLAGVLGAVAVGGAMLGGAVVAQRQAAAAADLAALAAAETLGSGGGSASRGALACDAAGRVSGENHARLTGCVVDGLDVAVEVVVDAPAAFGREWHVPGRARAGPSAGRAGSAAPAGQPGQAGPAAPGSGPVGATATATAGLVP